MPGSASPYSFVLNPAARRLAVAVAMGVWAPTASAEKADRYKPIVIEADKDFVADDKRQVVVYNGNAVLSQGSMLLRAERIELRELPDGYRAAYAIGSKGKLANWRQRRDGGEETVEGSAERIDYDGRSDTLRFTGSVALRRLRGAGVAEEISGGVVVWDNVSEVITVEGGAKSAANPNGRVRTVLTPRTAAPATPAAQPSGAAPLAPVRSLDERR